MAAPQDLGLPGAIGQGRQETPGAGGCELGHRAVQAVVQLQGNTLGEAPGTDAAPEGPGPRGQAQVGLEVAGVAEASVAHLVGMGAWCQLRPPGWLRISAPPPDAGHPSPTPPACTAGPEDFP